MKKITYIVVLAVLTIFISCKNDTKITDSDSLDSTEINTSIDKSETSTDNSTNKNSENDYQNTNKKSKRTYIVLSDSTKVNWTAFKTTSKIAVGGEFSKINFEDQRGGTISEAFNNLEFSIPISSLFTDDEDRDKKLINSFFNVLLDSKNITGKLHFDSEDMCTAVINMNGVTKKVRLAYFAAENEINFTGEVNLEDWDASSALESLNKACGELHKGADGKSKTWSEVAIHINTKY